MPENQACFTVSQSGYMMQAEVKVIGPDLLITLTGGDAPHIGAVTAWTNEEIETLRFPSHSGRRHKDDVLAEKILAVIAPALKGNCVITSGVHVNKITKTQIGASFEMAEALGRQVLLWLKEHPFTGAKPEWSK